MRRTRARLRRRLRDPPDGHWTGRILDRDISRQNRIDRSDPVSAWIPGLGWLFAVHQCFGGVEQPFPHGDDGYVRHREFFEATVRDWSWPLRLSHREVLHRDGFNSREGLL